MPDLTTATTDDDEKLVAHVRAIALILDKQGDKNGALVAYIAERLSALKAERDRMRDALQASLNWLASYPGGCADKAYERARAALSPAPAPVETPRQAMHDPSKAPGHTDLMVPPESIDAFMEANPLPVDPPSPAPYEPRKRPKGSNADEWQLFLTEHASASAFLAVQIAEAIDDASKGARA